MRAVAPRTRQGGARLRVEGASMLHTHHGRRMTARRGVTRYACQHAVSPPLPHPGACRGARRAARASVDISVVHARHRLGTRAGAHRAAREYSERGVVRTAGIGGAGCHTVGSIVCGVYTNSLRFRLPKLTSRRAFFCEEPPVSVATQLKKHTPLLRVVRRRCVVLPLGPTE